MKPPTGKSSTGTGPEIGPTGRVHRRAKRERCSSLLLEELERIDRTIQFATDPAQMINDVLDACLALFNCESAWLLDPFQSASSLAPLERTRPESRDRLIQSPGLGGLNPDLILKGAGAPAKFGPGAAHPLPAEAMHRLGIRSLIAVALHPKDDTVYLFGLHQYSSARRWTSDQERLLKAVGRRLTDALSRLLTDQALQQSEINYRRIVDTANEGIWKLGPTGTTVFVNAKMAEMLGYSCEAMIGKPVTDFMFAEDGPDHERILQNARLGRADICERRFCRQDRQTVWTLASVTPILDAEKGFAGCFAMFTDITERRRLQSREQLRAKVLEQLIRGDSLAETLESLILGMEAELDSRIGSIVLLDREGRHLQHGAGPSLPQFYNEAIHGLEIGPTAGSCGTAAYTGQRVIVEDIQTHPLWSRYRELAARAGLASCWSQPIVNRQGQVLGTFAIYHQKPCPATEADLDLIQSMASLAGVVIEHKRVEEEIRELNLELEKRVEDRTRELAQSEQRMRLFFERQLVGMAITSPEKGWITVNDKLCEMLGYSREELVRRTWAELTYPADMPADLAQFEQLLAGSRESYTLEKRFVRKDGTLVFTNLSVGCVRRPDQSVDYVLALVEDITQRKRAEHEAEEALQKEFVLRREMHHRVKNNLQVISSLLYLQSTKITDPNALALFKESQARIRSIALVHEMLYQRENLTRINFMDYARQLIADLFATYRVVPGSISFKCEATDVYLSLGTAIPCGIVITELITNALKYAFPDGRTGEIEVSLLPVLSPAGSALTVRDNGVGLPKDFDVEHSETMGLTLVRDLTGQLGGTLRFRVPESGSGTEVQILFPSEPAEC